MGAVLDVVGTSGFFFALAVLLAAFGGYTLYRMTRREALPAEAQGAFVAIPTTGSSVIIEAIEETHAEQVAVEYSDGQPTDADAPPPDHGAAAG